MRATFPPAARLHRPSEYVSALKGKRIARGAMLVLTTPRKNATDTPMAIARLGMVIAKRHAALSVTRNAIKRVLREAFRQQRHLLPASDFVFRLHSRVGPISLTQLKRQIRAEADALLAKARQ
ncbi:ribonuclease P protein component [Photobacterium phosphoreum]|nr:ribonuclease P protein component [Photobacterium phosphoreum]